VTHAGQSAIADVAAAQRPAVIIPQPRPFDEQRATARVLRQYRLAVVSRHWPDQRAWPALLTQGPGGRSTEVATLERPRRGRSSRRRDRGDRSTLCRTGARMRTAVITTVHGRGDHLRGQIAGLQLSNRPTDMHVVVALGDPTIQDVVASAASSAIDIDCGNANDELPVAQGRNVGAAAALQRGAELLVFLDVDCIPAAALIGRYHHAAANRDHAQALLCGPVTYLPAAARTGGSTR